MSRRAEQLRKLQDKEYRDEYLASVVRGALAYQMQAIRKQRGLSQAEFAKRIGKGRGQVSAWENARNAHLSIQTLLDMAAALDIGLLVRFVSYPEMLAWDDRLSAAELEVPDIEQSVRADTANGRASGAEIASKARQTKAGAD